MDDSLSGAFRPISPNPFIVGNPVRDSAMFFGREAEFDLARKRFKDADAGHLLVFCGERRSGKTSILYQIAQGRLGPEYIPVLIDMQSMAIETEADFLNKIAKEILASLPADGPEKSRVPLPDFSSGNPAAGFHAFVERVLEAHPGRKLVLAFDEYELFENKIESGTLTQDTLNIFAGLMDRYPVFVMFTGSQHIEDRKAECWRLLPKGIYRRISYLSRQDALVLMTRPVEGRLSYDAAALEHMYRLTAGQPFYTQALCQALVDHLNDLELNRVSIEHVDEVVRTIVENPFPQMIFLWDGLGREEKLVLSLLAEALADENAHVTGKDLVRSIGKGGYPIHLDEPTAATTLENLFKDEFLLKNRDLPAGYAFRMDLWRHWVRRMHSVWQVVREEKITPVVRRRRVLGMPWGVAATVGVVALAAVGWGLRHGASAPGTLPSPGATTDGGRPTTPGTPADHLPGGPTLVGTFRAVVVTKPENATVTYRGEPGGTPWSRDLRAGEPNEVTVSAPGYRDSVLVLNVTEGGANLWNVALAPLIAKVRIPVGEDGMWAVVDGARRTLARGGGQAGFAVLQLEVPFEHVVEVGRPGAQAQQRRFPALGLNPDTPLDWSVALEPSQIWFTVRSSPPGAQVFVDGAERGRAPAELSDLTAGSHRFQLRVEGFVPIDTVIAVDEHTGTLPFVLRELPPGVLIILGDEIASSIEVDDTFVTGGVQNSGRREVLPGLHMVEVVLQRTSAVVRDTVRVLPGRVVRYDYSRRKATVEEGKP